MARRRLKPRSRPRRPLTLHASQAELDSLDREARALEAVRSGASGVVRAIDLSRIIRRYAPTKPPTTSGGSDAVHAPEVTTP